MNGHIGANIKKARETKAMSQKEVAAILKMDQSQYSKIENGKTDPQFSTIEKVAKALSISVNDIVSADEVFQDITSFDKSLVEKVQLLQQLDEPQKKSIFTFIDTAIAHQKLKQSLSTALELSH